MAKSRRGARSLERPSEPGEWVTAKIPREAYDRVQRLLALASRGGWLAFDVRDRFDSPTIGALIDQGLRCLESIAEATEAAKQVP